MYSNTRRSLSSAAGLFLSGPAGGSFKIRTDLPISTGICSAFGASSFTLKKYPAAMAQASTAIQSASECFFTCRECLGQFGEHDRDRFGRRFVERDDERLVNLLDPGLL